MVQAVQANNWEQLKSLINKYVEEKRLHIGEQEDGWQFLFTPGPWEPTIDGLREYLTKNDVEITDGHGKKLTYEEFWHNEVMPSLYNSPNCINGEQYDKMKIQDGEDVYFPISKLEYTTSEGLRFLKYLV